MRDKAKVAELLAALKAQMTTKYELIVVEECEILLGEEWRDVEGYEGFYQVSDLGRVRSFQRGYTRILKPTLNAHGYPFVILRKNKHSKTVTVHRLIAEIFIQNPYNKPEVNHIEVTSKTIMSKTSNGQQKVKIEITPIK